MANLLVARASYFDRTYNDAPPETPADPRTFEDTATSALTTAVRDDPANSTPRFTDSGERFVQENATLGRAVGMAVEAKDDDDHHSITYSLDGADADAFAIASDTGQITVKNSKLLDFEAKRTMTVVVTVTDSSGRPNDNASMTMTILVVDVDEQPVISEGGLIITGRTNIIYDEGRYGYHRIHGLGSLRQHH